MLKGQGGADRGPGSARRRNTRAGRLSFTDDTATATSQAEAIFVCVGTPQRTTAALTCSTSSSRRGHHRGVDLTKIVVSKSVPSRDATEVAPNERICDPDVDFSVVSNPEFLKEAALRIFKKPDGL